MASGFLGAALGGFGGSVVGGAVVQLLLDDKQFQAAMAKNKAATQGAATGFSKFGAVAQAGFAVAATAAIAGAAVAVQAASDEEEALNKVNVVFGTASKNVVDFANTSAESFGISKAAALSAAGGFGNMLTVSGLTKDAAADMSVELVALAADMASFNNIDPTEALEKLRAGLAGEAEPLRQVGVLLSESRVQQEAYASGIAKLGAELTDAQKVQARYNIILKDTKTQQGDFARTSDSAANQQRILQARIKDSAAEIGRALLPAFSSMLELFDKVLTALKPVIEAFGFLVGVISDTIGKLTDFTGPAEKARGELERLGVSAEEAAKRVKEVTDAHEAQFGTLSASARFTGGVSRKLDEMVEKQAEAQAAARRWAGAGEASAAALRNVTRETGRTANGVRRLARVAGESQADFKQTVRESTNFVKARWEDLVGQSRVTATQIIRQFRRALQDQAEFARNTRTFARRVREEFGGTIPRAAQEMIADLAQRGSEGATIMAGLADATGGQIRTIVRQWKAGEEGPEKFIGVLERLTTKVNGLPNHRTINIDVNIDTHLSGPGASAISDHLASELIAGQLGP